MSNAACLPHVNTRDDNKRLKSMLSFACVSMAPARTISSSLCLHMNVNEMNECDLIYANSSVVTASGSRISLSSDDA